jgi:hypothetical protein
MIGRPRFTEISGEARVHGGWSSIVAKVWSLLAISLRYQLKNLHQDVRIENRREYTQPYVFFMPADENNLQRSCDIWVYRWEQPPRFVTMNGVLFITWT